MKYIITRENDIEVETYEKQMTTSLKSLEFSMISKKH